MTYRELMLQAWKNQDDYLAQLKTQMQAEFPSAKIAFLGDWSKRRRKDSPYVEAPRMRTPEELENIRKSREGQIKKSALESLKAAECRPKVKRGPFGSFISNIPDAPIVVEFDGGARELDRTCHGKGYGSFRVSEDGFPYGIERVSHEIHGQMTSNAAEVFTLCCGLRKARQLGTRIHVIGDSQNALNWLKTLKVKSKSASTSLHLAMSELRYAVNGLCLSVEWQPRAYMVKLFGH